MTRFIENITAKRANEIRINYSKLFEYEFSARKIALFKDYFTDELYILTEWINGTRDLDLWWSDKNDAEYTLNMFKKDVEKELEILVSVQLDKKVA